LDGPRRRIVLPLLGVGDLLVDGGDLGVEVSDQLQVGRLPLGRRRRRGLVPAAHRRVGDVALSLRVAGRGRPPVVQVGQDVVERVAFRRGGGVDGVEVLPEPGGAELELLAHLL
jgi:hypothetical protein